MTPIYFDHAASTPLKENALRVLCNATKKAYANPSSTHLLGAELAEKIESCRQVILKALKAEDDYRVVFTSSATEANNMVYHGLETSAQNHVVYCEADHPSITEPAKQMSSKWSALPHRLAADGTVSLQLISEKLSQHTRLVVLTHVNNHSGIHNPVDAHARDVKTLFPTVHIHVDASQSFGKLPLDLSHGNIDSVALSAHKMGGPKGISALILKKTTIEKSQFKPIFLGGGHEYGLRASTLAFPLILSWAAAFADPHEVSASIEKVSELNKFLRTFISTNHPDILFPFNFEKTSPYILTLIIPGISTDILMRHLSEEGICVSSSSACSSRIQGTNTVFTALGLEERFHKNVLRLSFAETSSTEEVSLFCKSFSKINRALSHLRGT